MAAKAMSKTIRTSSGIKLSELNGSMAFEDESPAPFRLHSDMPIGDWTSPIPECAGRGKTKPRGICR